MKGVSRTDVAIAHDYLTQRGGAEKVVLALHRAFPGAKVYTTLYEPSLTYPEFESIEVVASPISRIGLFRRFHRLALPFLASAAQKIHVPAQHTIVSSSGWAHGFRVAGSKIVYCYSPPRWLYQTDAYLGDSKASIKRLTLSLLAPFLKRWDHRHARTATKYFAISTVVRERIMETYGIDSEVLPAPHSIDTSLPQESVDLGPIGSSGPFYLCISRLLPYKNVGAVVDAFNQLALPLVVVGTGPDEKRLAASAGPSVVMRKNLTDAQIRWLYSHCVAVVSASFEDFGLTPIEAANFGKPSVVLRWGGFLDTVQGDVTGVYFDEPEPAMIAQAVTRSASLNWDSAKIMAHGASFSEERFASRLREEIRALDAVAARERVASSNTSA